MRFLTSWTAKCALAVGMLATLPASAFDAPAWDGDNAPNRAGGTNWIRDHRTLLSRPAAQITGKYRPWADSYWPSNRGGIAFRWNSQDPLLQKWANPELRLGGLRDRSSQFEAGRKESHQEVMERETVRKRIFEVPSDSERSRMTMAEQKLRIMPPRHVVAAMTLEERKQLSPTEKFDLARGDYTYWLTRKVLSSGKVGPHRAYWEGICHGWAPGSVHHPEPLPSTVRNRDGIEIAFGSADVKALIDYYYGTYQMRVFQMGEKCDDDLDSNPIAGKGDCGGGDVNAGAFHIVLLNNIGFRKLPVVADVSRFKEVWNNAIYWYRTQQVGTSGPTQNSARGTHSRVHMITEVRYPSDDERLMPQWQATAQRWNEQTRTWSTNTPADEIEAPEDGVAINQADYASKYRYESAQYDYWLELDAQGQIIGGEWTSDVWVNGRVVDGKWVAAHWEVQPRPDFVWSKNKLNFSNPDNDNGVFGALTSLGIYREMPEPVNTVREAVVSE